MSLKKNVLVIAGPTGSGESTITNQLVEHFPRTFRRLVTATTRQPRIGEKDTIDYYFFSKERFFTEKENGNIPEMTHIPNRDVYYGTFKPDLDKKLEEGYIVIMNPDIVGARYYKEHYNATAIFIEPTSLEELKGRLKKRDSNITEEELKYRLENAKREIEEERSFYDYKVVNADGQLEEAMQNILEILRNEGYHLER